MLSKEQNEALYKVGPGTLMGKLLRRYWQPIAAVAELDDTPIKTARLMGEDLVLYKDGAGAYGLVDRHCPHRRADLSYDWLENCGMRWDSKMRRMLRDHGAAVAADDWPRRSVCSSIELTRSAA